jgi:hypothetical protein
MVQHLLTFPSRLIRFCFLLKLRFIFYQRQQELIQRAREELDRERRNLLRRRPNCEVKEKPPKTPNSKSRLKDRTGSFVPQDESSNDGMKTTTDANKA